jgi:hypothetical protein
MKNTRVVATVGKPLLMSEQAIEGANIISEVTQQAYRNGYLNGYKSALVQVIETLPTDRKTMDIIQLKLILHLAIDACEEETNKGEEA